MDLPLGQQDQEEKDCLPFAGGPPDLDSGDDEGKETIKKLMKTIRRLEQEKIDMR